MSSQNQQNSQLDKTEISSTTVETKIITEVTRTITVILERFTTKIVTRIPTKEEASIFQTGTITEVTPEVDLIQITGEDNKIIKI